MGEMYESKEERWRATLRVMNERFKSRLDESVFDGVRDEKIYHGLKVTTATVLHKEFTDMCFCDETQEYLVLDKAVAVYRYSAMGKLLLPSFNLDPAMIFTKMMWLGRPAKCFAAYELEADTIWIMTSTFTNLQVIKNDFIIKAVYYEPKSNEILVVGNLQMVKYLLDEKDESRDLDPSKSVNYSDPEFGPTWQIDCTSLISRTTSASQLVCSYLTTIYVMPLEPDPESESDGLVEFSSKRSNASKAAITAVHFFPTSSWIITGDQQGNVMAYNLKMELMMSHSEAHADKVKTILSHPSICGFLTYSNGSLGGTKLQVWSCNFRDKIESFTDLGRIYSIVPNELAATVVVLATKLNYLTMHQIYCFFAPLTAGARSLYSSKNPMYDTKIVAASKDNSVRIFSAHGKHLNVQILPEEIVDVHYAMYSGSKNQLFTIILKSGEMLVSDIDVCPMKFRKVIVNDGPRITCATLYEYFDEIRESDGRRKQPRVFYPISSLVFAGTEEGNIIVINDTSGKCENVYPAHVGPVAQAQSSSVWNRLVSLGVDRCVKVWRIFADLPQPLALYYTLNFIIPITRICAMGHVLCLANSTENGQVHQVLMENMKERLRLKHHSAKDHTAMILDMITSETLLICATSSLDCTIRIWDDQNCLLKILEINAQVYKTTFSSYKGDIVFSAGRHLYKIPHENYLLPKYRAKIIAEDILDEEQEDSVPEDLQYRIYEDTVDRNRMLHPVISAPLACIDLTDTERPRVDVLIRKQICALYEYRDEDIRLMMDNRIEPTKLPGNRALMNSEAWDNYVKDTLNSLTRLAMDTPEYQFHKIRETQSKEKRALNKYGIFQMIYGYSATELDETELEEDLEDLTRGSRLPLNFFLPNSVVYKCTEKIIPKTPSVHTIVKEIVKYQYPPEFYPVPEEEKNKRHSIRLSQLMGLDDGDDGEEAT